MLGKRNWEFHASVGHSRAGWEINMCGICVPATSNGWKRTFPLFSILFQITHSSSFALSFSFSCVSFRSISIMLTDYSSFHRGLINVSFYCNVYCFMLNIHYKQPIHLVELSYLKKNSLLLEINRGFCN